MSIPVIFRKWRKEPLKGQLVAIFPTLPADRLGYELTTYERIGQHGAADRVEIISLTVPVDMTKTADQALMSKLTKELEGQGYNDLSVCKRITAMMNYERRAAARGVSQ
jgi:hypothetical protein